MISSKAIDLVLTFSEEEFRKFGLYVNSPYFNNENIQVKFYTILKKYYPNFENRNFEKEKVFAKLYPGKKYNDGVMRNILSGMLGLAEEFLTIQNLQENEFNSKISLMRELSDRRMEKLFEKAEIEAQDILDKREAKNDSYYYDSYLLLSEQRSNKLKHKSSLYNTELFLTEMSNNLTISFLINILKSSTHMANTNLRMFQFDYNVSLVNELELYLDKESEKYKDITYIQYYYNAFKLAKTKEEKYFFALKLIADSDYEKLTISEKGSIFTLLTNYCYYKINKGEISFRKEHFLIYKEKIERGDYKGEMHFLSHIQYLNVVITGLDAGEITWVEGFIERYKSELDNINMENTYNFSHALVNYYHKNYNEALNRAANVKTDDLSYKHQLKSFYLKIYYDMDETESFYSHVDSYKHFLTNEKHIPAATRDVLANYVLFTKKLFDIKQNKTEKDFEFFKIKKEIAENTLLVNKQWLLEKAEAIEKLTG